MKSEVLGIAEIVWNGSYKKMLLEINPKFPPEYERQHLPKGGGGMEGFGVSNFPIIGL